MAAVLTDFSNAYRYLIVIDDVWSTSAWELVQSALPINNKRSRIIATTRSKAVAKSCSTGIDGHMYEAKPLNEDSHKLFFSRISFSSECCPEDLRAIARDILKKCCGLPLAIISIAGLLTNRSRTLEVWQKILKSISSTFERDSPIEKMKIILLLSYIDLPQYLKSCFLYLSVFPEDYSINCRQLIWLWVAEGLIPGQNRKSMEQLGESYLNDLINRSMVQPIKTGEDGTTVKACRVHDVVLDFIVSQAMEDNFVAIWNDKDFYGNYSNKIRRLSIHPSISGADEEMTKAMKNVSSVRSLNFFGSDVDLGKHIPMFFSSQVLRVLNIQGTCNYYDFHVGDIIESCTQLKYLRINTSGARKLTEEIIKLQHLQTLDVVGNPTVNSSADIVQQQKLVRRFVPLGLHQPDGTGNQHALEEPSTSNASRASAKPIQGLSDVTKLRVLDIEWEDYACDVEDHSKLCIQSVSKLIRGLRTLHLIVDTDFALSLMVSCGTTTPPHQRLVLLSSWLNTVPCAMRSLVNLTRLRIPLHGGEASKEGIRILASLPMLFSLTLYCWYDGNDINPRHTIGKQGFQRLVKFYFFCWHEAALMFEPGAMPNLLRLKLRLKARSQFKYGQGGLVLGMQNLSALKHMAVTLACDAAVAEEVEGLEDDIRGEAGAHPNHPVLEIKREHTDWMKKPNDQGPCDPTKQARVPIITLNHEQ